MNTPQQVLDGWYQRVSVTHRAHYLSADHFSQKRYWLGVPAIALATLVGTSVFATLQKQPEPWVQITVGLASVAAALLTSLQTFLGYSERAEKHRLAGAKYGALGRELESLRSIPSGASEEAMAKVRERLNALSLESPSTPQKIYYKAGAGSLHAPGTPSA